jgi:Tfp pilus assembly protein PilF
MALAPGLALMALAFLLYVNAIGNPFIIDDAMMVLARPELTQVGGFWQIGTHGFWEGIAQDPNLYRPVTVFSYWLHGVVVGLGQTPVRCVNIALLGFCAWAGGALLCRFMNPIAGWVAAGVWLALPSNTESINHTVGRADLLALLGILLFLLIQQGAAGRGGWTLGRVILAVLAGLMAAGAKETGLLVAPCALAQAWVLMPGLAGGAKPGIKQVLGNPGRRFLIQSGALVLGVAGVYLAARFAVIGWGTAYPRDMMDLTGNPLRVMGWQDRLAPGLSIMFWYFTQSLWPSTAFNHTPGPGALPDSRDLSALLGCVMFLVLLGVTIRGVQRRAWVCVPGVLTLGGLALLSNILFPIGVYCANRLTPGVTMGFWMLFAVGIDVLIAKGEARHAKLVVTGLGIGLIAVSGVRTAAANTDWASLRDRMKADAQGQGENPIALYHLGASYLEEGDYAQAAKELERVVPMAPKSAQVRMNLAGALLLARDYDKAKEQYLFVLAMEPAAVPAFRVKAATALGMIAMSERKFAEAEGYLGHALAVSPEDVDALFNLGEVYKATQRYAQAMTVYGKVLQIAPGERRAEKAKGQLEKYLAQEQMRKIENERKSQGSSVGQ